MSACLSRRLVSTLAILTLAGTSGVLATPSSLADTAVPPVNSHLVVTGAGWGHGKGMSQYGAYGAAESGLSYAQILAFYYTGTKLGTLKAGNTISVLISADDDNRLHVAPASGLRITDSAGKVFTLPTSTKYKRWRISRSGSSRVLHYLNSSGSYVKYSAPLSASRVWTVSNPTTGYVVVRLPDGKYRDLREKVALRFSGSGAKTVNTLSMENYLRGVVPAEMPTSWHAEAVKAQAVAARSYAARYQVSPRSSIYDICDTTACQVYKGLASRSGSTRTLVETANGNAAIAATAHQVVMAGTSVALTMFSSSNGGHSADGGLSYLTAKADPYDGKMRNQKWSKFLTASAVQSAYPSIGTLTGVQVTARDGDGPFGGRAETVVITGTKGKVSVNGGSFKSKFGLKERLFAVFGGLKPGTGNADRWQALGGTPSWVGAPTASEAKLADGGLQARFEGADLYWSAATGSKYVTGSARDAYRAAGAVTSELGYPKTDTTTTAEGTITDFSNGRITCPTSGDCVVSFG